MEKSFHELLSEQLRPQSLDELNLPTNVITSFKKMEGTGFPMNLLFYGKPGIGKTSAARILIKNSDAYELNGSFNNGDKTMVNLIMSFATTMSLFDRPKVVFIDEADMMSRVVQDSLRYQIEQVSKNTRFILTANDLSKVTPAIRSRCLGICFDVLPKDRAAVVDSMTKRYERRLKELELSIAPDRLKEIVGIYFPDLREIANQLQLEIG